MTPAGWQRARHSPRATRRRHDGGKTADENVAATARPIADRFISSPEELILPRPHIR